jgi:predicted acyltransferase
VTKPGIHHRLEALDVFRGLTIAAMILVSTPGTWEAVYGPLEHATWDGWTATDLVFPFLLFAMGAAVPFAMARRRGTERRIRRHVIRRALILFALGLLLNAIETPPPLVWSTFRIPGVLQRIALVYAAVAWLAERTSWRTQAAAAAAALVGYWAVMVIVPVPGVGRGVLTPEGNVASFIDRALLGRHLAHGFWDPEGVLSTIPAIATALFGVFAGDWLNRSGATHHRTAALLAAGLSVAVLGLLWDQVFPINKSLWTSSFALWSGGLAAASLAACHWVLDVRRWRGWEAPFMAFGRNALVGYTLSVGVDSLLTNWTVSGDTSLKSSLYQHLFADRLFACCGAEAASLGYALAYVAVWGVPLGVMYRKRVFVGI